MLNQEPWKKVANTQLASSSITPYVRSAAAVALVWLKLISKSICAWSSICRDYYTAAAIYEHLTGLSDTELRRRGLSRDTLARDICDCVAHSRGTDAM